MSEYLAHFVSLAKKNYAMLIIILAIGAALYLYYQKPSAAAALTNEPSADLVKTYGIIMFYNPVDPDAIKQLQLLKNYESVIEHMDTTSEHGVKMAKDNNIPIDKITFISSKYHLGVESSGDHTMKQILFTFDNLRKKQAAQAAPAHDVPAAIKDLDIILVTEGRCGHCIKAKKMWKESGLESLITIVPLESEAGSNLAKEHQLSGFPSYISKKTGKSVAGNYPFEKLIGELS